MRYAVSYTAFYGIPFEEFVETASRLGFLEVEFIPDQAPNLYTQFNESRLERIRQLRTRLNMDCSVHNVFYDINLLSLVPAVADSSFGITQEVVALAKGIGAKHVTVHPGYMFPGWRLDPKQSGRFWQHAGEVLSRLGQLSIEHRLPILIENGSYHICTYEGKKRTPLHVGISPEEMQRLIALSDGSLGVCLDVGKAAHSGYRVEAFIELLGPKIAQVQIQNLANFEAIVPSSLSALGRFGFKGTVLLEGDLAGIIEARQKLEDAKFVQPQ